MDKRVTFRVDFKGPVMGATYDTVGEAEQYAAKFSAGDPAITVEVPLSLWKRATITPPKTPPPAPSGRCGTCGELIKPDALLGSVCGCVAPNEKSPPAKCHREACLACDETQRRTCGYWF